MSRKTKEVGIWWRSETKKDLLDLFKDLGQAVERKNVSGSEIDLTSNLDDLSHHLAYIFMGRAKAIEWIFLFHIFEEVGIAGKPLRKELLRCRYMYMDYGGELQTPLETERP